MTRRHAPRLNRAPGLGLLVSLTAVALTLTGVVLYLTLTAAAPDGAVAVLLVYSAAALIVLTIVATVGWSLLSARDSPAPGAPSVDRSEMTFASNRQLLDDVRHELKTPIAIVRGHLEVMDANDPVDVAVIRDIGMSELDRMTRLIGDIDLLAGLESDNFTLVVVDLDALTHRVSDLVAMIPGHTWEVEQVADGEFRGDQDRLVQAWLQLADNAAKYTPQGSCIRIGSARHAGGVQMWVRDHGPGIPPAQRHRIFRRFDRGNAKRTVGGSGLGLAIVDTIAKAHGGYCAVGDTPGGGATFTLEIPIGTSAELPAPIRAGDVLQQREASG